MRIPGPIVLYQPADRDRTLPLGLLHLGSALAGQPVVVVDGRLDLAPEARVVELAREALCLGVTVRTGAPIADALRVTRAARAANPTLPVVWGGPHPTFRAEECLAPEAADVAARGWGERTLVEIVAALREREPMQGLPGVAWGRDGAMEQGETRAREEISEFPPVDYGLVDLEAYFRWRDARRLDYCSSRGRPGSAEPWTGLGVERLVAELVALVRRHRVTEVAFADDDFFGDPRRAEAMGRGLLERGVHVAWSGAGQSATLRRQSADFFRAIAGSGCRRVRVTTPGDVPLDGDATAALLETAERLHQAGIGGRFAFTAGHPQEPAGLQAIHRAARSLHRIDPRFETPIRLFAPYPGANMSELPGFAPPQRLEDWAKAGLETGSFVPPKLAETVHRYNFHLTEAYRPPGRRVGKKLLRLLARIRVWLGFYALDVERRLVEGLARMRGRARLTPGED